MSNIVITSDSTCDLSPELCERYSIEILPLKITLGDMIYKDGVELTPDQIYEHHAKTGQLPKTTAANIAEFTEFFQKFANAGKTVIHFNISSGMSSTYSNSRIVASEFENIYVIDSKNLSTGIGLQVIAAAEMAKKGMEAEKIVEEIEKMIPCVDASFVIDSLEYLYKGGRCSALEMLGANLLKLKPCIEVRNGVMGVGKKYRGRYADVLKSYAKDKLADLSDIDLERVFVTHAGCAPEIVDEIVKTVKELAPFKEVFMTRAGCTISSHCGANTLGVLFVRKSPVK
ncbi:MAG: DegV family protein [Acutalibacteraceae bacterium]|jgi:DegV family protein with EDD domain